MSGLRVACVCGQSGAVSGLAPVLQEGGRGGWNIRVLAYGEAVGAFQHENVSMEMCEQSFGEKDAIRWLKEATPEVVLLGTDASRHVEKRVVRAAKELGIPSIMYVDFWSNYAARFEDNHGLNIPDALAVLDAEMASSMELFGIERERLHIIGSPALERASLLADLGSDKIHSLRTAADIPSDCVCVLFVSSPGSSMYHANNSTGTFSNDSLLNSIQELACALECCKELGNRKVYLVVRPHPREEISELTGICCGDVRIRVEKEGTGLDWVSLSDLVVGLDTMLLVEAMMARRPVLCLAYVRSLIPAVSSMAKSRDSLVNAKEELPSAIERVFSPESKEPGDNVTRQQTFSHGATKHMIELVTQCAEKFQQRRQ